jgi:hypothetical protein
MPASKEKEERMWKLADKLARSGRYSGWLQIEWELRSLGYSRARYILDIPETRKRLDKLCSEASQGKSNT